MITTFVLIETAMITRGHQTDVHAGVLDSEVITNMCPNSSTELRLFHLHRKPIEICSNQLKKPGVARLHARLSAGFFRKITTSLCALSVTNHREISHLGISIT